MIQFIASILPTLQHIGVLGYWVVLIFALLESLAFVGMIVPGGIVVIFAGVLSAQGYLDPIDLVWFAAIGAIIGDTFSYYLGTHGTFLFSPESRFFKLNHLERGEEFFKRHGGKSIFLGRFIGPLRPIVPFIAGLSRMRLRTFLVWNIASGFLWALSHILLGYVFGNVLGVIETWSSRIGLFLLAAAALAFVAWYLLSRRGPIFLFLSSISKSIMRAFAENPEVLRLKEKHPRLIRFVKNRLDASRFSGRTLTLLALGVLYTFSLLVGVVEDVITSDTIVVVDERVANLVFTFRDAELLNFFTWITFLGQWEMVAIGALGVVFLLWLWGRAWFALPLMSAFAGSELFTALGKVIFQRPRPAIAYYVEQGFSFPSGHATIAVAFYGFLAYILIRSTVRWPKKVAYGVCALSLIVLIGASRIYLGVHYVSDVLAGYLVGLLWFLVAISISEWLFFKRSSVFVQSARHARTATLIIFFVLFFAYITLEPFYSPTRATPADQTLAAAEFQSVIRCCVEWNYGLL